MRILRNLPLIKLVYESVQRYPAPINLSYMWNFGVYSFVCLFVQIVTGLFLAMHYVPHTDYAFHSVEYVMREVSCGWLFRYVHANGASMFFIVVFLHTFRNIYYSSYSYPRQGVWFVGVIILVLMIATAFLGYVLPWGQMSFWGATVITNLFTAIPVFGKKILMLLWGGYSITTATLVRFYALHFLFPFVILGLVLVHIYLLHIVGSNNPLGVSFSLDKSLFYLYIVKDFYGVLLFFIFFSFFVFMTPNYLGHPDNYIEADPLLTPAHIVPEWYFLLFYAILRSIPDKFFGIMTLALALVVLGVLPLFSAPEVRSMNFRPYSRIAFYFFVFVCFLLTFIGGRSIEFPFVFVGQMSTFLYFSFFIFVLPGLEYVESFMWSFHDADLEKVKE